MGGTAIVFGGAGFIGSHLLAWLSAVNKYARLVCADVRIPSIPVPGVSYRFADVREPIPFEIAPSVDAVFNLAAIHRTPGHRDAEYYDTNILGAVHVTRFARQAGAQALVFTSSIAVYGQDGARKTEVCRLEPQSAYGQSKLLAERLHMEWQQECSERRLLIVRPGAVFGSGENGNFTRLARALNNRTFFFPGRKNTVKACGDVDGLISAMVHMMAQPEHQITFNYCYPEEVTLARVCSAMCRVAGWPPPWAKVPAPIAIAAASCLQAADQVGLRTGINPARVRKLQKDTNVFPEALVKSGFDFNGGFEAAIARWYRQAPAGAFR